MEKSRLIHIRLPATLHKQLASLARRHSYASVQELVREALREFVAAQSAGRPIGKEVAKIKRMLRL